jgi:hypothetical protein
MDKVVCNEDDFGERHQDHALMGYTTDDWHTWALKHVVVKMSLAFAIT